MGYNELIDMSGVSRIEFVSSERVSELANLSGGMDSPVSPSKLAIFAASDLHFGLGRMYESYRQSGTQGTKEVRVFRALQEALQWLGVSIKTP